LRSDGIESLPSARDEGLNTGRRAEVAEARSEVLDPHQAAQRRLDQMLPVHVATVFAAG
jgi:hypothetical protein